MNQERHKVVATTLVNLMRMGCVLVALAVLVSCSSSASPEMAAQAFVRAMASGNSDFAARYVCSEQGVVFLVAIRSNWSRDSYEVLDNDDQTARVRVKGRVQILDKDVKQVLGDLKIGLELAGAEWPIDMPDPTQLPVAMTVIVDLDFDQLSLQNNDGEWCVQQSSLTEFYVYLADLLVSQLGIVE